MIEVTVYKTILNYTTPFRKLPLINYYSFSKNSVTQDNETKVISRKVSISKLKLKRFMEESRNEENFAMKVWMYGYIQDEGEKTIDFKRNKLIDVYNKLVGKKGCNK